MKGPIQVLYGKDTILRAAHLFPTQGVIARGVLIIRIAREG